MSKVKVLEAQNLFDITVQEYGQIDSVFQLASDNGINGIDTDPDTGTILNINIAAVLLKC